MIDRYLQQVPEEKVSLEGITPIRWDEDEASGKANPQNQRKEGEKIDPVKLDAALLKDLEAAKKTKEEGGKESGGVDIAVMGKEERRCGGRQERRQRRQGIAGRRRVEGPAGQPHAAGGNARRGRPCPSPPPRVLPRARRARSGRWA